MANPPTNDCQHQRFMRHALELAEHACSLGEVPVGAVLVRHGEIIGEGFNRPISTHDPTAHAELVAIRDAATRLGNYRLPHTTLYVTIEPCTMCLGAIMHARLDCLVYGAPEPKAGVIESNGHLTQAAYWNHRLECRGGMLAEPASALMQRFFRERRAALKAKKAAGSAGEKR